MDDLLHIQKAEIEMLRERIRQLENALVPPSIIVPIEYRLTGSEARMFAHLASRDFATKDGLMLAMYSDRPDEAPEPKIVDVFICRMRKKIARFGVEIETIWGKGFALKDRERFQRQVAA